MSRFSKKALQEELQVRMTGIQSLYGFDPSNGSAQIEAIAHRTDRGLTETAIAYGSYMAVESLVQEYDLLIDLIPEGFMVENFKYMGGFYKHYKPVAKA